MDGATAGSGRGARPPIWPPSGTSVLAGPSLEPGAGQARPPPELLDKGFQRLRRADSAFGAAAE